MLSVVIGRFQAPKLSKGHNEIIRLARNEGSKVLVLIGTTSAEGTDKNPLCFNSRRKMIRSGWASEFEVVKLPDLPSDEGWSKSIDEIIASFGYEKATIYGGRDNSIQGYYSGKHEIKIIDDVGDLSATEIRERVKKVGPLDSVDFRSGMIYQSMKRYPIVYSTVDVAFYTTIVCGSGIHRTTIVDKILMGRKGDKFMFVGGFIDPEDKDLFEAAAREVREETGFIVNEDVLQYEFSCKVDDPRYKGTKDSIMTHFLSVERVNRDLPDPKNISDKEFTEFKWMEGDKDLLEEISDTHKPLFLKFINLKN